jgi:hypothetical protein
MIVDYPWGRSYERAILETNRSKLAKHVQLAEQAIMARVQELNRDGGGTEEERAAIRDALSGLKILHKELAQSVSEGNFGTGSQKNTPPPSDSRYIRREEK